MAQNKIKILNKYIYYYITISTILVLTLLFALDIIINFLTVQGAVGTGDFDMFQAFLYVLLCAPGHVLQMFPIGMLLGVILGLGILIYRNELLIIQSSGFSVVNITLVAAKIVLLFSLLVLLLGEFIAPQARQLAELKKMVAMASGQATANNQQGLWLKNNGNFVHIETVLPNGELHNVTKYYMINNNRQLRKIVFIKSLKYHKGNNWLAKGITVKKINLSEITTTNTKEKIWVNFIKPGLLSIVNIDADNLSIHSLVNYINYLDKNNLSSTMFKLELWRKLLQPLVTFIMICFSVPFLFGKIRSSHLFFRFFIAIFFGFLYFLLDRTGASIVQIYKFPLWFGLIMPIITVMTVFFILYRFKPN